jgi:hypothetical protein
MTIQAYNDSQNDIDRAICDFLVTEIKQYLPFADSKVWHGHPVWFINENPIVGYSKQKKGIRLMFWSGASFEETGLTVKGGKFQDASIFYNRKEDVDLIDLHRWLEKSKDIQWDYKNIVKRKGVLERLK